MSDADALVAPATLSEHLSLVLCGGARATQCDLVLLLAALVLLTGGRVRLVRRLLPVSLVAVPTTPNRTANTSSGPSRAATANTSRAHKSVWRKSTCSCVGRDGRRSGAGARASSSSASQKKGRQSQLREQVASASASACASESGPALWLEVFEQQHWLPLVPLSPSPSGDTATGVSLSSPAARRLSLLQCGSEHTSTAAGSPSEWAALVAEHWTPCEALYALAVEPRCCTVCVSADRSNATGSATSAATVTADKFSDCVLEERLEGIRFTDRTASYFPSAILDHRVHLSRPLHNVNLHTVHVQYILLQNNSC